MTSSQPNESDVHQLIDAEASDEGESRATKQLYEALVAHRQNLSGGGLAGDASAISERNFRDSVHREASRRSAEITAYRGRSNHSSGLQPVDGHPIPKWVILAWIIAIVATAAAFWWLISF